MTARTRIQTELQSLSPGGGGLSRRPPRYGLKGATSAEFVGNKHDSVRWLGEQGCRGPSSLHEDGDNTENTKDGYFVWIGDYEARKSTPKNHEGQIYARFKEPETTQKRRFRGFQALSLRFLFL